MAQRRKRRSSRSSRPTQSADFPGWAWMLFGLAIGLSVAFAVHVKDRKPAAVVPGQPQPASMQNALDDNDEPGGSAEQEKPKEQRFTFYDMLPNFEVVIPEQESNVKADVEPRAVVQPGVYVLQAGSFSSYADADRRRAQLALQGIESKIQRVTIDDKTYHRVRIGPIDDLDELNVLRSRLRAAQIDALRIRLGD
jgi:cell division protein FtsN